MTHRRTEGFTLIDLLIAVTITALIVAAGTALLSSVSQGQAQGFARAALQNEALRLMERMASGVRVSTLVMIPNAHRPARDILAFSGAVNDDHDFYFGDPLFPRIDEDCDKDMTGDVWPGIAGLDDNGDGRIDDGHLQDDDEDGLDDEDPVDRLDNDGDGDIDEDTSSDANQDAKPGIVDMDDNGDGLADNSSTGDDDEDGRVDEDPMNPVVYTYDSANRTLRETLRPLNAGTNLSTRVTQFSAVWDPSGGIVITLTLAGDTGESVTLSEYACPRNRLQWTGKRCH